MASTVKIEATDETANLSQTTESLKTTETLGKEKLENSFPDLKPTLYPWETQTIVKANPTTIRVKKGFQIINNASGVFPCKICDRQFSMAGYLANHMQREHAGSKFVCETCGKQFEDEVHFFF